MTDSTEADIVERLRDTWPKDSGYAENATEAADLITKLRAELAAAVAGLLPFVALADQADEMSKISASVGHNAFEESGLGKFIALIRDARAAHRKATTVIATEGGGHE